MASNITSFLQPVRFRIFRRHTTFYTGTDNARMPVQEEKLMSEVSKTEIGRRFFKLQKEKQVEKAIEKIRQAQGSEWVLYSQGDIEALMQVLGEVWIFMERDSWDQIAFTRLSGIELRELIRYGRDVHDSVIRGRSAAEKSRPILVRKDS
jgi:hypothetical protein